MNVLEEKSGRRVSEPHVDRSKRLRLGNFDQGFFCQFQQGDKVHHQYRYAARAIEQVRKFDKFTPLQGSQDALHMFAHREFFAADLLMLGQRRPSQQVGPRRLQFNDADIGPVHYHALIDMHLR